MNRTVLLASLLPFLYPPHEYIPHETFGAAAEPETRITFRLISPSLFVISDGIIVGSPAQIARGLWLLILGGIALATLALAHLFAPLPTPRSRQRPLRRWRSG